MAFIVNVYVVACDGLVSHSGCVPTSHPVFQDMLWIQHDPERDKADTKDKQINERELPAIG